MRSSFKAQFCKRLLVYCVGLFIMALGVAFSVKSDLGVSPVNAIPYVLSEILEVDMGRCIIAVFSGYILLQLILLGRRFAPWRLLQIICSVLFGYFTDFSDWLLGLCLPDFTMLGLPAAALYGLQLLCLVVSMALVGLGIFLYLAPGLMPLPGEGLMQVIAEKWNRPLHHVKIGFDCTVLAAALLLSLFYFHGLHGVREGSVIAAVGVGKFLGLFSARFRTRLARALEREAAGSDEPEGRVVEEAV